MTTNWRSRARAPQTVEDPVVVEEVEQAIRRLKPANRFGGSDSLTPEHLKFWGPIFKNWLCQLFNHLLTFEQIPTVFKQGVIIPVYKGKGRDPLLTSSYRGITLTSVLAKSFEFILFEKMLSIMEDLGCPQLTQAAYRKNVSCVESMFASQEALRCFTTEGDLVYSSLYDLQSAFDTVEYSILPESYLMPDLRTNSRGSSINGTTTQPAVSEWETSLLHSFLLKEGSVRAQFCLQLFSTWSWTPFCLD